MTGQVLSQITSYMRKFDVHLVKDVDANNFRFIDLKTYAVHQMPPVPVYDVETLVQEGKRLVEVPAVHTTIYKVAERLHRPKITKQMKPFTKIPRGWHNFDGKVLKACQLFIEDYEIAIIKVPELENWDGRLSYDDFGPFDRNKAEPFLAQSIHFKHLYDAVYLLGPDMAMAMFQIICKQKSIEAFEKQNYWPSRSGKIVLALAGRILAHWY